MKNLLLVLSPVPTICLLLICLSPRGGLDAGFLLTKLVPVLMIPTLSLGLGTIGIMAFECSQTKDRKWIVASFALAELPIVSVFVFALYRLVQLNH